jgi:hypothetical protein
MSPVVIIPHAAAAAAEAMRKEEEEMTGYSAKDMDGWEFKIVRSNTGKFRNPETVRQLCLEEAKAGWEMLEKFDNNRIRFKRRTDKRIGDAGAEIDPYRSHVGMGDGRLALVIVAAIAMAIGLILAIVMTLKPQ